MQPYARLVAILTGAHIRLTVKHNLDQSTAAVTMNMYVLPTRVRTWCRVSEYFGDFHDKFVHLVAMLSSLSFWQPFYKVVFAAFICGSGALSMLLCWLHTVCLATISILLLSCEHFTECLYTNDPRHNCMSRGIFEWYSLILDGAKMNNQMKKLVMMENKIILSKKTKKILIDTDFQILVIFFLFFLGIINLNKYI